MSELLIITGGSRGIGLALARRFLARGAEVVNLSRSPCPLEGVTQIVADLSHPEFPSRVEPQISTIARGRTRVVLVHNAAMLVPDDARSVDPAVLARTLAVSLVAPAALNRVLIPRMPRGSSILYVGSTLSEKAAAGVFSYVVSKHATIGMMRATCQDLAGSGIHTVCVCPGVTDTEMLRQRVAGDASALARLQAMTGEGRLIEPDEIASVLAFAADNPVLNGTVMHANLGQREH